MLKSNDSSIDVRACWISEYSLSLENPKVTDATIIICVVQSCPSLQNPSHKTPPGRRECSPHETKLPLHNPAYLFALLGKIRSPKTLKRLSVLRKALPWRIPSVGFASKYTNPRLKLFKHLHFLVILESRRLPLTSFRSTRPAANTFSIIRTQRQ